VFDRLRHTESDPGGKQRQAQAVALWEEFALAIRLAAVGLISPVLGTRPIPHIQPTNSLAGEYRQKPNNYRPIIGDAKSLVIHPASTTHSQLTPAEQETTGVTADSVRLAVGLEDIRDILADLKQALEAAV